MKILKIIIPSFLILLFSINSIVYAETLKFGSSSYEGEVKKDRAHGNGVITFADGSKYEGQFKKNRIHGKGKYTDAKGNVFEGKFVRGNFKNKIDKKTRQIIKLDVTDGMSSSFEMRPTGSMDYFEAEKTPSGTFELTAKGQRDMVRAAMSGGDGGGGGGGGGGGC